MDTPVPELATDTRSLLLFLFVTVGLGGGAAAIAGHPARAHQKRTRTTSGT